MNDRQAETPDDQKQWIVVVSQPMTYEEADKFGKMIGEKGYTGTFLNGTIARQLARIPKLKAEIERLRGGDEVGETVHKA